MENSDIRVLVVDDDDLIRECVTAYLEDEGLCVLGVASGEDGLSLLSDFRPAVCVSDLRLPGMNGDEFILKAHVLCPETAYMLHTGMTYILSDQLRAIGMTFNDVLLKPIHDLSQLVGRIRQHALFGRRI